ncbi:MAG: DUF1214 domain-containing protein [Hyphomicrobium sp.]
MASSSSIDSGELSQRAAASGETLPGVAAASGPNAILDAIREGLKSALRFLVAGAVMVAAIVGGVASSRYMVDGGSPLTTDSFGPWRHWRNIGRTDADPYTRAHIAASGALNMSVDSAGVYEAFTDENGARLHSSCDYVIEGPDPLGLWWSLAVFDREGRLIANDAERYAFTRDTVALNPNGSYIITLGRDARPGNWLPTGGAGRLALVFTVLDPATGLSDDQRAERNKLAPAIRREGCS